MAFRTTLLRALAGAAVLVLGAGAALAEQTKVTFVLTNDLYQMSEENGRGGMARLASVVKTEKAKGRTVLFVHAGDAWSPCLLCGFDQGAHMVALLNEFPPDIFVPGNHEFDFGKEVYFKRHSEAKFPFFAANLRGPDGEPLPGHADRTIVDANGVKIGIVGLALHSTPDVSSPGDLKFEPVIDTLRAQAQALREEGADFLVAVAHTPRTIDFQILDQGLVDVLLTGHDHDLRLIYNGRTVMAESGQDAQYVIVIELDLAVATEEGKRVARWHPSFRIIDSASVTPDPIVAAKVKTYEDQVSKLFDTPIAKTEVELDTRTASVRTRETNFGDLVADAIRASTGAQAAIVNGGGIRGNRTFLAGTTLTPRDVRAALPFDNKTLLLAIKGRDLRAALENGFSRLGSPSGRFPQVSGLSVEVDPTRLPEHRVLSIAIGGEPLKEEETYRLATVDFLWRGGDDYVALSRAEPITPPADAKSTADDVIDYLRRVGTVNLTGTGRIIIK